MAEKTKNLCIIQARFGSTRLPGKVLIPIGDKVLLEHVVARVNQANRIDKIIIATTNNKPDDVTEKLVQKIGIECFRGPNEDVLGRLWQCAEKYLEFENIIRITGDCPLIDPRVIDEVIEFFEKEKVDYASNVLVETYPDGMDVEIFTRRALQESAKKAKLPSEREHVTLYIRNNPNFSKANFAHKENLSHFRLTVDNQEDLEVIKFLIENSTPTASFQEYISLLIKNPDIMSKNSKIKRNEGLTKSIKKDKKM